MAEPRRPQFNPADVDPGEDTVLDIAWGHVRYVPATGHIRFATDAGGFWVVELEPQVRQHLALPPTPASHPDGRPGTLGTKLAVPAALRLDVSPYYCTPGSCDALVVAAM